MSPRYNTGADGINSDLWFAYTQCESDEYGRQFELLLIAFIISPGSHLIQSNLCGI